MSLKIAPMSQRCRSCSVSFLQDVFGIRWSRQLTLFSFSPSCTMCGHLIPPSLQRYWIVKLMPTTSEIGGTFQPSLDEAFEQAQPGRAGRNGGGCEVASPLREAALRVGTRWVLWSEACGVKKTDTAIVKQKCPAQVLALGRTCQRDRRGFLAAPKGLCQVGDQCCNPSCHPFGLAYTAGLSLCWHGAFPAWLLAQGLSWALWAGSRGSAWSGAQIPLWRAGSVTEVRKDPPAIKSMCIYKYNVFWPGHAQTVCTSLEEV